MSGLLDRVRSLFGRSASNSAADVEADEDARTADAVDTEADEDEAQREQTAVEAGAAADSSAVSEVEPRRAEDADQQGDPPSSDEFEWIVSSVAGDEREERRDSDTFVWVDGSDGAGNDTIEAGDVGGSPRDIAGESDGSIDAGEAEDEGSGHTDGEVDAETDGEVGAETDDDTESDSLDPKAVRTTRSADEEAYAVARLKELRDGVEDE